MRTPRLMKFFFGAYAVLTAYIYFRLLAGLPFQLWTFFLHPVMAFAFAVTHAWQREGARQAGQLIALALLGTLAVEAVGVATGGVFGAYHYTLSFGPLFLGLVPYVIPIVWFYMLYPAYVLADRVIGRRDGGRPVHVAAVAGLVMVAWDLALDPVMVARGHWVWDQPGAYFGIPLQNFWGWWLTTFVIVVVYLLVKGKGRALQTEADRLALWGYALMGGGSVLSAVHARLWGPVAIGVLAMGAWVWLGFKAVSVRD